MCAIEAIEQLKKLKEELKKRGIVIPQPKEVPSDECRHMTEDDKLTLECIGDPSEKIFGCKLCGREFRMNIVSVKEIHEYVDKMRNDISVALDEMIKIKDR